MENNIIKKSGAVVLSNAGVKLEDLTTRHSKAKNVYSALMAEVNNSGVNDDIYKKIVDLLGRFKKSRITFNEERTPTTVAIDNLKKPFLSLENDFDLKKEGSMAFELKKIADVYAQEKAKQETIRTQKLQKQQAYDNELSGLSTKAEIYIKKCLFNLSTKLNADIDTLVNSVSIDNSASIREEIMTMNTEIPVEIFNGFVKDTLTVYTGDVEKQTKFAQVMDSDIYANARKAFDVEIFKYQQSAIQKIPAIIEELQEIAAADAAAAAKLLEQKAQRELGESQQKKAEAISKEQDLDQEAVTKEQSHTLQANFNFGAAEAEIKKDDIKKKVSCYIKLVLPAGLQEIFKFWVTNYDAGTDIVKIRNWTIDRMIRFAEKEYNKNGNEIVSEYVIYKESIEAKI